MKKIINILLIMILAQNLVLASPFNSIKKNSQNSSKTEVEKVKKEKIKKEKVKKEKVKQEKIGKADKKTDIQIVKEKKTKKPNLKKEQKKQDELNQVKLEASIEAQGMYESKFPKIQSTIEYTQAQEGVTLSDCIKLALSNHPKIASAISNAQIYQTKVGLAWANYFPSIGAGVSYSRNDMLMTNSSPYAKTMNTKYNMYYAPTLSANMLLFDFGKTKANVDMAQKTYEQSRYEAEASIETVIYNVKAAYYNMLFAKAQKVVYEDTVKDYELQLKQASAFFKIGKKAKIDVTTAEYNLGNAKVNLIKAKNTLELASVQLANAIGIPEFDKIILKDELNTKVYDVEFNSLYNTATTSRPSLLAAKKKMDAYEMNIRSARREYAPNITAFGGYDRGGNKIDSDSGYQLGVQLNYQGLNLMSVKKHLDEARASYKKAAADYENEKQNVYLEVKSAFINLSNSYDSFLVAKLALKQAKEQQYQAYRRYEVGLGNAIEFKDAENTYLNAQLNYYSNLLEYNINAAELERVVGAPIKESTVDL